MIQYCGDVSIPARVGDYRIPAFAGTTTAGVCGSPPKPPHPLQHLLDMGDRGFRQDAVAEVEDQPAGRVICQHVIDRSIEGDAAKSMLTAPTPLAST